MSFVLMSLCLCPSYMATATVADLTSPPFPLPRIFYNIAQLSGLYLKKRINSLYSSDRPGAKYKASAARNGINSVPQSAVTTFALSSV